MIEEIVQNYLIKKLACEVYIERPEKPPKQYIILEKTGSSRSNFIQTSTIAVQSYGSSLHKAAELNETVKTVMDALVELDEVCRIELNSDYNYTDPKTKQYRYQAVYHITHY